jgi:hypothetical protein
LKSLLPGNLRSSSRINTVVPALPRSQPRNFVAGLRHTPKRERPPGGGLFESLTWRFTALG